MREQEIDQVANKFMTLVLKHGNKRASRNIYLV